MTPSSLDVFWAFLSLVVVELLRGNEFNLNGWSGNVKKERFQDDDDDVTEVRYIEK